MLQTVYNHSALQGDWLVDAKRQVIWHQSTAAKSKFGDYQMWEKQSLNPRMSFGLCHWHIKHK
jgi:hypothetical protein